MKKKTVAAPKFDVLIRLYSLENIGEVELVQRELAKVRTAGYNLVSTCATGEHTVCFVMERVG